MLSLWPPDVLQSQQRVVAPQAQSKGLRARVGNEVVEDAEEEERRGRELLGPTANPVHLRQGLERAVHLQRLRQRHRARVANLVVVEAARRCTLLETNGISLSFTDESDSKVRLTFSASAMAIAPLSVILLWLRLGEERG